MVLTLDQNSGLANSFAPVFRPKVAKNLFFVDSRLLGNDTLNLYVVKVRRRLAGILGFSAALHPDNHIVAYLFRFVNTIVMFQ